MRQLLGLLAGLAVLVTMELAAFAQQAEIAGIDKVYLRSGPSTEQPPLGVLSAGDPVTILGNEGTWTNVRTQDGKVGYVHHRYVVPLSGEPANTGATAAPPVSAPAQAAVQPISTPTAAVESDELSAELAGLRAEVARLRQQVEERKQQAGEVPPAALATAPAAPNEAPAAPSAREQGVAVLAVAGLSLLVGWLLGSAFSRRRSRSHRPRLRI